MPVKTPKLKDVTTNSLYPAYKTEKGIVIQLNGPKTVLPSGATLAALVKFVDASRLKTVLITGGAEKTVINRVGVIDFRYAGRGWQYRFLPRNVCFQ